MNDDRMKSGSGSGPQPQMYRSKSLASQASISFASVTAVVCVPTPICFSQPEMSLPALIWSGDSERTMNRKSSSSPPPGMFRIPSSFEST